MPAQAPLWRCPRCERTFANVNQTHTCARLSNVDDHFAGADPQVRETFDAIVAVVRSFGPVDVLAEKTRIALHVRMSFAAFVVRKRWLDGHVVLAREIHSPRFKRVEVYSRANVLHAFRLTAPEQVDEEVRTWLAEAHAVGQQQRTWTGGADDSG
jgi:hypothetical protein